MNQVQEGLFAVEESMPCTPNAIAVPRYVLPTTFGRLEPEEVAARILSFSQETDQWVGVSEGLLVDQIREEYETYLSVKEAHRYNVAERRRVKHAVRRYYALCILTIGIHAFRAAKPKVHLREIPDVKLPFSGIFVYGVRPVVIGINDLTKSGLLREVTEGEGEDAFRVYFPTPELVSCIMQKQGVAIS